MTSASYEETQKIRELNAELDALRQEVAALRRGKRDAEAAAAKAVAAASAAHQEAQRIEAKFAGQEREVARLQTELAQARQAARGEAE